MWHIFIVCGGIKVFEMYVGLCIDSFVFGIFDERGGWYGICVEVNNGCVGERGVDML